MKKLFLSLLTVLAITLISKAQTGTEFWFAPPEVTYDHNSPGGQPIYLLLACLDQPATVTVSQPANAGFNGGSPMIINLAASESYKINLTPNIGHLETEPTNTILNTGLLIESTNPISAYYEVSNTNNCDIFALKGANSLGYEFYIPLQNHVEFYNHTFGDSLAYASFDIVATQDNTTVRIFPTKPVDGHAALTQYTVTLNRGQTYSCAWTGAGYTLPANHPSGSVVVSDKPIAITIKDDSAESPGGGCYDLMGDQIVPVNIIGKEYIVIQGQLFQPAGDESFFILATENNTEVYINGSASPDAVLFAGETFRYEISAVTGQERTYIECTKPVYCTHVTGFGCEQGQAILPPLNCAGSEQISFVRSTSEAFYLNLLIKDGFQNDFTIIGPGTATINPASFLAVPGTGGIWVAAQIQFNTTEIPVDQAHLITNSSNIFSMGIINGGAGTGCRYGYFSEFVSEIFVDAGSNQTICSTGSAQLAGSVSGGATTGIWTSDGSGVFVPSDTDLNAEYFPSAADITNGSVQLTLASTSICFPEQDIMVITINPGPIVDAGIDQTVCENNINITLNGSVLNASGGGYWSGGAGTFIPSTATLNAQYVPTAGEISSGSVTITLNSVDINCDPVTDDMAITFTPAPTASAGIDVTVCANNPNVTLNGIVTNATGGQWNNGTGSYSPGSNALSTIYTPSAVEISNNFVTLTLTTTGIGNCLAVNDNITINFSASPLVNAGTTDTYCANNPDISLNGSITGATGGIWSGGLGVFSDNTDLSGSYSPTAAEIASASVTLTLTSTGNGTCNAEASNVTFNFTGGPTVNAGADQTVCANNEDVTLNGAFTVSSGASWSGGTGSYSPNNTTMNAVYSPSATEITNGTVTLTLTTTGNGDCLPVNDNMIITITPAPVVNAGSDLQSCVNNAQVTLTGSVLNAGGGVWSNGGGIFSPSNIALGATYTPSAAEISAGIVSLTLTSTGNGNCIAVSDIVTININPEPIVNAGPDQVKCANNSTIQLAGSVSIASGGQWTGGLGVFIPNNNTFNAVYNPTATEIANGFVNLTLTSTGNGNCNPNTDDVSITFTNAPTANAGVDQVVCANNSEVTLNGSVTIATGGIWSGGAGTFTPGTADLSATYQPSPVEIAIGSVTLTLTTTGNGDCVSVNDNMIIAITTAPVVNAGSDLQSCVNNAQVTLTGSVFTASGGIWSNGGGIFSPSNIALGATYTPSAAEISAGIVSLTLTSTGNGNCIAVSDVVTININPEPIVDAGPDQIKCANNSTIQLAGSVSIASGGQWTGGLGVFSPNNIALNAEYYPTATEIANGFVNLTLNSTGNGNCNSNSDDVYVTFTNAPTANAGTDQTICSNNSEVTLNGSVTIATGGIWSGGAGTFTPGTADLSATYQPSPAEITAGSVTLTLTTTGNGDCVSVNDNMIITFTPSPIVNAGSDLQSCVNNAQVTLTGSVSIASGGIWSNGGGIFSPSNIALGATYTPSAAEISAGIVSLTLTSTGNGNCNAVSDVVTININPEPIVNAGPDQIKCANNSAIQLAGSISIASGGQWTGGLGVFSPNSIALNAVYYPTATEIANGFVNLTLTSTGNGNCNPNSNDVYITFTNSPTVNAGIDQAVCANNAEVTLNGSVTIATGGIWSGGAGTFTPGTTDLSATYQPSPVEIAVGSVTLTLTTTGNGDCVAETDQMIISIAPAPVVNAGSDLSSCANNPDVTLNGNITYATGGIWSGGSGVFNPSAMALNAVYTPSGAEIAAGSATLILTSTGNGSCSEVTDQVLISIGIAPTINAGTDFTVCSNNPIVVLNGSVSGASGGVWSGGLGVFNPNNSVLNSTYFPSASELASTSVSLTLTSTGNGNCNPVNDIVVIFYTTSPTVDAGLDQNVCANNPVISLSGIVTVASGGIWSGGMGTFTPSNTSLICDYTPTATEISNGVVNLSLTSTGNGDCSSVNDQIQIIIDPSPYVNAGGNQTICVDDLYVDLNGMVSGPITSTGIWTSSGTGSFVPNASTLDATYICSTGDSTAGYIILYLNSTNNDYCNAVTDSMEITILPGGNATAGSDVTVCANNANVNLGGSVSGGASGGTWTSSGSGVFVPNITTLNATYVPSSFDTLIGNVTLTLTATSCNLSQDAITITITPAPFVNAGPNIVTCVDDLEIELSGIIYGGTTTGQWSSNGTGIFTPSAFDLNATYTASSQDSINQEVVLLLTSTNNGDCIVVTDSLYLSILPAGVADAGFDQTYCSNNAEIELDGSVSGGATEGMWSTSGTGEFIPNNTTLDATYFPSSADTATGSVTLVLTATNSCNFAMDVIQINFSPAPTANAGSDQTVCENNTNAILSGAVTIASGGIWSTSGSGSFLPSASNLNATYIPSSGDISNGEVVLVLTTTGNGGCNPETDSMRIFIDPAPVAWAGPNQQVCQTSDSTVLLGNVSGGTSTGIWTTSGTGTFSDDTDLGAYYIYSPSDIASGSVTLTLSSTNNGNCIEVSDDMIITFGDAVFAYAGEDINVCASDLLIDLDGFISGGSTTGSWASDGTGSFVPDNLSLSTTYICSPADSVNGLIEIILTSTNNGGCLAGHDTLNITISPIPIVNAGEDISVCLGTSEVTLATIVNNATGVIWTSLGSGEFQPNDTSLSVSYIPSEADSIFGNVTIIVTSTGNNVCFAVRDTVELSFEIPLIPGFTYETACLDSSIGLFDNSILLEGTITDWEWIIDGIASLHAEDTSYTFSTTGLHEVSLTVNSSLGCEYTTSQNIFVNPLPEPAFSSSSECFKDAVGFIDESILSLGNISSWQWEFGDGENSNEQNPDHLYSTAGNYEISLTLTTDSGCVSSLTNYIDVYTRPAAGFSYVYDCQSVSVEFIDTSSSSGNAIEFWNWSFGDGNVSSDQNPNNSYSSADTYTVQLISGSSPNCSDTANLVLTLDKIVADFTLSNSCPNEAIAFTDITDYSGSTASTWTWDFDDGFTSVDQNPNHAYSLAGNYSVSFVVTTIQGCIDSIEQNLQVYPRPLAGFIYSADEFLIEETIEFTDQSTGGISWNWNFGDSLGSSIVQNPMYIYYSSGIFEVEQVITNQFGCTDTARNVIVIDGKDEIYPPKVPNTFTPNDDQVNDVFYVRGGPFSNLEFKIFNGWGQLIFESYDADIGWDGTYKGKDQPIGVYVYTIKATTVDGTSYSKSGDVTIIR